MTQPPRNANPPVFIPSTAAEYLGMTERQVRDAVRKKRLSYVRLGQNIRFRVSDLDEYLEKNTVRAVRADD